LTFLENKWTIITLAVLCWAVVASLSTGYYYFQYSDLSDKLERFTVNVSLSIDYGNGTIQTFTDVYLEQNATALDALRTVEESVITEHWVGWGSIVTSIGGITNEGLVGWQYWVNENWGLVAADLQILVSGDLVEWKYAPFNW